MKGIVKGGFFLERECPIPKSIKPEEIGFKKVSKGSISALSIYDEDGALYRKVREVDNIIELLSREK